MEVMRSIVEIGYELGHVVTEEKQRATAEKLIKAGWTAGEIQAATDTIPTNATLVKEVTFARGVNAGIYALAREYDEVKRGRLFSYQEARAHASEKGKPFAHLFETAVLGERTVFFLR